MRGRKRSQNIGKGHKRSGEVTRGRTDLVEGVARTDEHAHRLRVLQRLLQVGQFTLRRTQRLVLQPERDGDLTLGVILSQIYIESDRVKLTICQIELILIMYLRIYI